MFKLVKAIKQFLLDLILPIECLGCQKEGEYFCGDCQKELVANSNAESDRLSADLICPSLEKVFIAGNYENPLLKNLITHYKYHFLSPLNESLGNFLIKFWRKTDNLLGDNLSILVIPIPLSNRRLKWRGFNQAELLANFFAKELSYQICLDLKRKKHCRPQVELTAKKRLENIHNAFRWLGDDLSKKTIILIDDVATTGATLEAAAKSLEEAGAEKIYGLVLAKG